MNDRYRNVCKALDHIVKCRTKEAKQVFIPYWGYVFTPSVLEIYRITLLSNKNYSKF